MQKFKLVKFVTKHNEEKQTQTDTTSEDEDIQVRERPNVNRESPSTSSQEPCMDNQPEVNSQMPLSDETENSRRYHSRTRKKPDYLNEYESGEDIDDQVLSNIDYCYRLICNSPMTFSEAVKSPNSKEWKAAMDEEMQSLKENNTFTLTSLPEGKKAVGGRWLYVKENSGDGSGKYKARYVAKGYNQSFGIDCDKTFSPTANLTSIRVLMQCAIQENLILHQMDVKTAYLHAPIDFEVYVEQLERYEVKGKTD